FLVAREDGQVGVGPGGEWFCAPGDLEPEVLPMLSRVSQGGNLGVVVGCDLYNPEEGHRYHVRFDDGDCAHAMPRLELELAPAAAAPVLPTVASETAATIVEVPGEQPSHALPYAPQLVAEMADWRHDMRVPLNHGARFPTTLPNDSAERKEYPLGSVWFGQFPAAMVALARHSWEGNNKHNPGMSLRDDRTKSNDDLECALRHLLEGDYRGAHWRVARLHQKQLEAEGAPVAPLAYFGENK
uniref:hypothetical protein n=1 Tax=Xanthomonas campestris pv. translucens TaxID=343 RepID=UPI000AC7EE56